MDEVLTITSQDEDENGKDFAGFGGSGSTDAADGCEANDSNHALSRWWKMDVRQSN
jgi:hypothetical protein